METEWPAVIQLGDTVIYGVVRNASTSGALFVLEETSPSSLHATLQNETVLVAIHTEQQPDGIQINARVRRAETCEIHRALSLGLEFSGRRLSYADF